MEDMKRKSNRKYLKRRWRRSRNEIVGIHNPFYLYHCIWRRLVNLIASTRMKIKESRGAMTVSLNIHLFTSSARCLKVHDSKARAFERKTSWKTLNTNKKRIYSCTWRACLYTYIHMENSFSSTVCDSRGRTIFLTKVLKCYRDR